jgi:hypothetical protein
MRWFYGAEKRGKVPLRKEVFFAFMIGCGMGAWAPWALALRPLATDDAWTVDKGKVQAEFGLDYARLDNRDREASPSLTLSYGVTEWMEGGVGTAYLWVRPEEGENTNGLGDTTLKGKFRLWDEKDWLPAGTVAGLLKLPTASEGRGLGSGRSDGTLNFITTKNLTKKWALHLNLGYTLPGFSAGEGEASYSLAGQFTPADYLGLVGEVRGSKRLDGSRGENPLSALLGAYWLAGENLAFDVGVEIGMNSAAPDYRLTGGLTFFFKP